MGDIGGDIGDGGSFLCAAAGGKGGPGAIIDTSMATAITQGPPPNVSASRRTYTSMAVQYGIGVDPWYLHSRILGSVHTVLFKASQGSRN